MLTFVARWVQLADICCSLNEDYLDESLAEQGCTARGTVEAGAMHHFDDRLHTVVFFAQQPLETRHATESISSRRIARTA